MKIINFIYKNKHGLFKSVKHDKEKPFNKGFKIKHAILKSFLYNNSFIICGFFIKKDALLGGAGSGRYSFQIAGKRYSLKKIFRLAWSFHLLKYEIYFYLVKIPCKDFIEAEIHNAVFLRSKHSSGINFIHRIKYNFILNKITKLHFFSPINIWRNKKTSFYFRQSVTGNLYFSVRKTNKTDSFFYRGKIFFAYLASISIGHLKKFRKSIIIFEKECGKYEESGSVVYEKLIDLGFNDRAYFILSKEGMDKYHVPEKYKHNIVRKDSLKHYLLFFSSNIFISTESPAHAIDLRIANTLGLHRLNKKAYSYVFLQHGVTFMLSLSANFRKVFRKGLGLYPSDTKIVVSSTAEAQHFIEQGGFSSSDIYITGLPKFDRATLSDNAKNITIMPTWRPWEYNLIRNLHESSGYFKMLEKMLDSVPDQYKNRVIILPHPLFIDSLKETRLNKYIRKGISYDEALKETEILITDYSSIAYDSFNRGAKVIFWWEDKDFCMKKYGGKLMLDETNVFGPVAYKKEELHNHIKQSIDGNFDYNSYMDKFREIVFDFNKESTNRLITKLSEDNLI